MDYISQGNIVADYLASQCLRRCTRQPDASATSPVPWVPYKDGQMICGDVEQTLLMTIYRTRMIEYWSHVFSIPEAKRNMCDWDMFFRSIRTQLPCDRLTILKYNTCLLSVGRNLKRRLHSEDDTCPCCGNVEDHDHIVQCKHPAMEKAFQGQQLARIYRILLQDCSDSICSGIIQLLLSFRSGGPPESSGFEDMLVFQEQLDLGMRPFLAGLWLKTWRSMQTEYFTHTGSRKSPELWVLRVIHLVQGLPISMWKVRNHLLHNSNDNNERRRIQHRDMNDIIDKIYERKAHARMMSHCDESFFRTHEKDVVKQFKLHRGRQTG